MVVLESTACGGAGARDRRHPAAQPAASARRLVAAGAAALILVLAGGCGSDGDRNDVPVSPSGGKGAGADLPSQEKLERRVAQARGEADKLERQLKRTSKTAKQASK